MAASIGASPKSGIWSRHVGVDVRPHQNLSNVMCELMTLVTRVHCPLQKARHLSGLAHPWRAAPERRLASGQVSDAWRASGQVSDAWRASGQVSGRRCELGGVAAQDGGGR